jgi:hypothetical protein
MPLLSHSSLCHCLLRHRRSAEIAVGVVTIGISEVRP